MFIYAVNLGQITPASADFSLTKDAQETFPSSSAAVPSAVASRQYTPGQADTEEQFFAADYDPSKDHREDEERRARIAAGSDGMVKQAEEEGDNSMAVDEVADEEEDDYDDLDDMFAISMKKSKGKSKRTIKV